MKKYGLMLVLGAAITIVIIYRSFAMKTPGDPRPRLPVEGSASAPSGLVVVPSSVSKERARNAGLANGGSVNMRHLLVAPQLNAEKDLSVARDYRPIDAVEWILDIEFDGDPALQQGHVAGLFGHEWLQANGRPTLYGWSPEGKHWTYLVSADAPRTLTKLCIAWMLIDPLDRQAEVTPKYLERFEQAAVAVAEQLGKPKITLNRSANEAAEIAIKLKTLVKECQQDVLVVLVAPDGDPFRGQDVWDVMQCLGLEWGDGDLFHWENESGTGGDFFFSVETTTHPGYFVPEQIAAGDVRVADLVFSYSIPRSAAPEPVFDSLLRAVEYARERLGGTIQNRNRKPFDPRATRVQIRQIVDRLRQAGFEPGAHQTLVVF